MPDQNHDSKKISTQLKILNTVSIKLPKAKSYNLLHSIIPDVGLGLQKI